MTLVHKPCPFCTYINVSHICKAGAACQAMQHLRLASFEPLCTLPPFLRWCSQREMNALIQGEKCNYGQRRNIEVCCWLARENRAEQFLPLSRTENSWGFLSASKMTQLTFHFGTILISPKTNYSTVTFKWQYLLPASSFQLLLASSQIAKNLTENPNMYFTSSWFCRITYVNISTGGGGFQLQQRVNFISHNDPWYFLTTLKSKLVPQENNEHILGSSFPSSAFFWWTNKRDLKETFDFWLRAWKKYL